MTKRDVSVVTIDFEGKAIEARATDTIAAALLREGVHTFSRGPKYHRPHGAFCLTGNCAQCHMRVSDEPNVATCTTPVRPGLHVERQNVLGSGDLDLLRAVDFLYPGGIDHHHLMTRFKLLNEATKLVARRLAGVGYVPTVEVSGREPRLLKRDVVIIGAGPSGLRYAAQILDQGGRPLVLERRAIVGGHVVDGFSRPGEPSPAELTLLAEAVSTKAELAIEAEVTGLYSEGGGHFVVAIVRDEIWEIQANRVVIATGGQERNLPFESNDLPGVYSGRGLLRLATQHGVVPGHRAVVVAAHRDAIAVCRGLRQAGAEIAAFVDVVGDLDPNDATIRRLSGRPIAALGMTSVTGLRVHRHGLKDAEVDCDLVAVVAPPTPCFELAAEVGATTRHDEVAGGFVLATDAEHRTSVDWISAVGTVAGRS